MQNDWSSPSGSRWEPVPRSGVSPLAAPDAPEPGAGVARVPGARRSRRRGAAVVLTLLGAAGVTAGAAFVPSAHEAPGDERGARHAHGPDGPRPGGFGVRGPRAGGGTGEGDEPTSPSGASS